MDWDEPLAKAAIAPKYDTMSVADLEERIAALQAEIEKIRAVIESKHAARGNAASFFKS